MPDPKYNVLEDPILERQNLLPLIRTVFEEGKTVHFSCQWDGNEIPGQNFKGALPVSIDATMFPVFDADGRLINVVLNWIDVSDKNRIESERQELEQQLKQSQKMEAIGTLAGGVAHDFNNILGIMLGNAELALDDIPDKSPVRKNLQEIQTAGLRAKEVIRQLLSYSRKAPHHQTPYDLGRLVQESLNLLRASIPSSIKIVQDIPPGRFMVNADATQIHQVITCPPMPPIPWKTGKGSWESTQAVPPISITPPPAETLPRAGMRPSA
jgi:signal transduction histidine kinase